MDAAWEQVGDILRGQPPHPVGAARPRWCRRVWHGASVTAAPGDAGPAPRLHRPGAQPHAAATGRRCDHPHARQRRVPPAPAAPMSPHHPARGPDRARLWGSPRRRAARRRWRRRLNAGEVTAAPPKSPAGAADRRPTRRRRGPPKRLPGWLIELLRRLRGTSCPGWCSPSSCLVALVLAVLAAGRSLRCLRGVAGRCSSSPPSCVACRRVARRVAPATALSRSTAGRPPSIDRLPGAPEFDDRDPGSASAPRAPGPATARRRRFKRACATGLVLTRRRAGRPAERPARRWTCPRWRGHPAALDPADGTRRVCAQDLHPAADRDTWSRSFDEVMALPAHRHADVQAAGGPLVASCCCPTSV